MPLEVLQKAQEELINYSSTGCSVMEMSHRSKEYEKIIQAAEQNLRDLMEIPDNYRVLFLQGGASLQFSMIPMNLATREDTVGYVQTGMFASKAKQEADRWCKTVVVGSSKEQNYTFIPEQLEKVDGLKYLHITGNNTIYGTCYNHKVKYGDVPIVADWSSAILGKWFDIKDYALVYAGAQKNMGPAGVTVVIIREDMIREDVDDVVPSMLQYCIHTKGKSMYNTPPTYGIYMIKLMTDWVKQQGGIKELEKINQQKAKLLYDYIDGSEIFHNPVEKKDRSIMNVIFTLDNLEHTEQFIQKCKDNGIINIKGHRSVGGCRASIYNGMPIEGVEKLIEVMKDFAAELIEG